MLQTRKNVLDKARTELADSINSSNQIYTNEELSTLIQDQSKLIEQQKTEIGNNKSKISGLQTESDRLRKISLNYPIGEVDLFIGNYYTTSVTETSYNIVYHPLTQVNEKFSSGNYRYNICYEYTTTAHRGTNAYMIFNSENQKKIITSALWGVTDGAIAVECEDISSDLITTNHSTLSARTDGGEGLRIYRAYLQVYKKD